jgi:poly(3-hydroxybutyrate) depolymerase
MKKLFVALAVVASLSACQSAVSVERPAWVGNQAHQTFDPKERGVEVKGGEHAGSTGRGESAGSGRSHQ